MLDLGNVACCLQAGRSLFVHSRWNRAIWSTEPVRKRQRWRERRRTEPHHLTHAAHYSWCKPNGPSHSHTPHVEHSSHALITHSGCSDMPTVAMMQEQLVRQQQLWGQPWQSEQHSEPETQTGSLHWLHWDFIQMTLGLTGWGKEEESENLAYIYTWPWVTV